MVRSTCIVWPLLASLLLAFTKAPPAAAARVYYVDPQAAARGVQRQGVLANEAAGRLLIFRDPDLTASPTPVLAEVVVMPKKKGRQEQGVSLPKLIVKGSHLQPQVPISPLTLPIHHADEELGRGFVQGIFRPHPEF